MRIGYPCINLSLQCRSSRTFRLKSYSQELMEKTVRDNLSCLQEILQYNLAHGILYFRISSDLIPFASHPICDFPWQEVFSEEFKALGGFVKKHKMRVTMHPDQFILINALEERIITNSVRELVYHAEVLDLLGVDLTCKIQIHVGGAYGDKKRSMTRFSQNFRELPPAVKRRLVVENDERIYSVADCMEVHRLTGIPVVLDALHHSANNRGETLGEALSLTSSTWRKRDGLPMVDYSSQKKGAKIGTHAYALDLKDFRRFLAETRGYDFDLMLEVKNKERSALRALKLVSEIE